MNSTWTSGILVIAVSVTIIILFQHLTKRSTEKLKDSELPQIPIEFSLAKWIKNLYLTCLITCTVAIALLQLFLKDNRLGAMFLPCLFAVISGVGLIVDTKKKVRIDEKYITYQNITGAFKIPIIKIINVYSANGFIVIDIGEKFRKAIPLMFQGNNIILRLLQDIKTRNAQQYRDSGD